MTNEKPKEGDDNLFRAVMEDMVERGVYPECFESMAQFRNWGESTIFCPPSSALGWCEDCTSEYQTEMKLQERCERDYVTFSDRGVADMPEGRRIFWVREAQTIRGAVSKLNADAAVIVAAAKPKRPKKKKAKLVIPKFIDLQCK